MHTFVIPVYRQSAYLEQCIQHLLNQTIKSKIVLTTSTPTPFAQNMAHQYKLPYFVNHSELKGIAHDWNFALSKAETPLVTIAHQDDIYEPDYAELVVANMQRHQNKQVLIAFTNYTDVMNGQMRTHSLNALVKRSLLLPFLFSGCISNTFFKKIPLLFGDAICCPSVTFNMAALGGFEFPADYKCALDWYAWYQLARQKGAFLYLSKKLMQHRIHMESATTLLLNNGIRTAEERRILELMWGKTIAGLLLRAYTAGYKDNEVK